MNNSTRAAILLGLGILAWLASPMLVQADSQDMLQQFWSNAYGYVPSAPSESAYWRQLLAKAKVDECFYGLGNVNNLNSFKSKYPNDFSASDIAACISANGLPKVNQAYVWGLTKYGAELWLGTVANTLCLVLDGFYPSGTFPAAQTDSWECEMSGKDIRPPRIFVYNTSTNTLTDMTGAVLGASPADAARLGGTVGLRSAGNFGGVVFLGGISSKGVTLFAFNAATHGFLGSITLDGQSGRPGPYTNIRQWRVIHGQLYTGMAKPGGGNILRWTGSLADPFHFDVVGNLTGDPAYLVEHANRIFVSTWGIGGAIAGTAIVMSRQLASSQDMLTTADQGGWTEVFNLGQYEVEPAAPQAGGALASFGGYLYWGTMHVPGTGLVYFNQLYPTAPVDLAAFLGTYRPIVIFRGRNFGTASQQVELLYGSSVLPKFDSGSSQWQLVPNGLGQKPTYGWAGFNNFFNNYTWSMDVYNNELFVGTMDWLYLAVHGISSLSNQVPPAVLQAALGFEGADLWKFYSTSQPAVPVSITGVGNQSSYGIRTMFADDALYLGMANPMNLLTDNSPGKLLGGWELLKLILDVPTTTTIKSSSQFFSPGQKVTFTATVTSSPAIGAATGTITFIDSGLSQTVLATVPLSGGKASLTTALPDVTQYVKAVYSGDKYYKGSESGFITEWNMP
ncbi:MAG TPA: Ig-like domain-containing protein [Terriglobales bacterium]|nr:Ig-like domain-containing protein [Terriglobales bacterium]